MPVPTTFGAYAASASVATTTFNPAAHGAGIVLSGADLSASRTTLTGTAFQSARATSSRASGKYYFEVTVTAPGAGQNVIGVMASTTTYLTTYPGGDINSIGADFNGIIITNAAASGVTGPSFVGGGIVQVAVDISAKLFWYRLNNGTWSGSGNPATGTGGASFSGATGPFFPGVGFGNNVVVTVTANFGGTSFFGSPPSGFVAWG